MQTSFHVCSYSDFGGSAPAAKPPKSEGLRTTRKNSKIGGFASTAKTPKSEVLRSLKNISYNIWYSKIGGSAYYTQKLQKRRFCAYRKNSKIGGTVVLKILVIIFNTPKSEVLRTIRKNSKNGGFAPTAKTPKSEGLCTKRKNSKIGGLRPPQKLQNRRFCVV